MCLSVYVSHTRTGTCPGVHVLPLMPSGITQHINQGKVWNTTQFITQLCFTCNSMCKVLYMYLKPFI